MAEREQIVSKLANDKWIEAIAFIWTEQLTLTFRHRASSI